MDKNIIRFEKLLEQIDRDLSKQLLKISPTNIDSEKKKFFSIPNYEPVFKYDKVKISKTTISNFEKLGRLKLPAGFISQALIQKAKRLEQYAGLISAIGTNQFSSFAVDIYGKPSQELIKKARIVLKKEKKITGDFVDSEKSLSVAKKCISEFNLSGWKAKYAPIVSLAMVQSSAKTILVRKNTRVPKNFLKRMIVHEVATHVFRSWNGKQQPYKIFSGGFANYLETEEGLAANMEDMYGCLDNKTLRTYAARVLAVYYGLRLGFRETFKELRKNFDENDAWQITLRVKRGLSDTKESGCYPKDHLYLKGYFSVKKYLSDNKKNRLERLLYGKISLAEAEHIDAMSELVKPKLLPTDKKIRDLLRKI